MNKNIILFVLILGSFNPLTAQKFAKATVLSDLEFLYQSLEEAHYDLYKYTTKTAFQENYLIQKQIINEKDSLDLKEITTIFQKVIAKANTGHGMIFFPVESYRKYAMNGGTLFPLEIIIEDDKALILKNYSNNQDIKIGTEITSINNQPIDEIIAKMHEILAAESTYFKNAKLEVFTFPRLYWQLFGEQKSFDIVLKNDDMLTSINIESIKVIEEYEMVRTDIFANNRTLKFYNQTAYLNPGNFSGNYAEYQYFIDSIMSDIKENEAQNLIIDLRNNSGGDNEYSDYLVSYFADKSFSWCSDFTLKSSAILKAQTRLNNDTTANYFKAILEANDGEIYKYQFDKIKPQPYTKRYKGKVYILINRHSYSMAAVASAMIQDYNFATIIGEETADFPTLLASQFNYSLPNTGIPVFVPKGYMIRPNGSEKSIGVIPDIQIKDNFMTEKDEILESVLDILEASN